MFRKFVLFISVWCAVAVNAANEPVWKNPLVNQQNREARRANFFAFESEELAQKGDKTLSQRFLVPFSIRDISLPMHSAG